MKSKVNFKSVIKSGGLLVLLILFLSGCSTNNTKQSKSQSSTSSVATKSSQKKTTKTDLATLPLVGKWKNSGGAVFEFQADGKWIYQTANHAKTDGTYQLAGAYNHQILLKIHGLDQSIGGIGNYLGMALSKKDQSLFIVGFGQFARQGSTTNISTASKVRLTGVFNQKPTKPEQLLVGTWMNTDETAEVQLTTNYDPDGQYQRYNSKTNQVERGSFTATVVQNNEPTVTIKLTNQNGKVTTENYQTNGTWTQLTNSKNKVSTVYVKNQMPNMIQ